MNPSHLIAKHLRDLYLGGNWTAVNVKNTLDGVDWQMATTKVEPFHSILSLLYHMNYYVKAAIEVLEGNPLTANDKYAFDHPEVLSATDWEEFLGGFYAEIEDLAVLIEKLPAEKWESDFWGEKYGNYYRNLHGIIEHSHYHLGQILWLKRMIQTS